MGKSEPVDVGDVARYILKKLGRTNTMKLQKLVYYSQAWSLVWDETPLFSQKIEAWANGPVVPKLFSEHRKKFEVDKGDITGSASNLDDEQKETVDAVLGFYGHRDAQWLVELTHREAPWVDARRGLAPGERGTNVITHAAMAEYYSGVAANAR